MPKDKPREKQRKDVWLPDGYWQKVEQVADQMRQQGIDPTNQFGEVSLSKVVQFLLDNSHTT